MRRGRKAVLVAAAWLLASTGQVASARALGTLLVQVEQAGRICVSRQIELRMMLNLTSDEGCLPTDAAVDADAMRQFCSNPAQYEWQFVERQKMLLPFNSEAGSVVSTAQSAQLVRPDMNALKWSLHHVLVVEGNLLRGESNLLARRRFFIDEASWLILYGEGYDLNKVVTRSFIVDLDQSLSINRHGRWYAWGK